MATDPPDDKQPIDDDEDDTAGGNGIAEVHAGVEGGREKAKGKRKGKKGAAKAEDEEKGFFERILPALLTFVGVLITAYVTLTSVALKQSQTPTARISVGLGGGTIVSVESGTISKDVYVVPVGQELSLSSAGSVDPDGDFSDADVEWTINQTYPLATKVHSEGFVNQGRIKRESGDKTITSDLKDQIVWKVPGQGGYQIILSVLTRRACWFFLECAPKKVSAVLHLEAREKAKPQLRIKDTPPGGTSPLSIQVDASGSESFDREEIGAMHFDWLLDDKPLSKLSAFNFTLELAPNGPDSRQFSLRGTVTDRWGSISEPLQRNFVVTRPNTKIQTVDSKPASADHGSVEPAVARVPAELTQTTKIGDANTNVEIRGRVNTHGHQLVIIAKTLTSLAGEIVSGPTVLPPAPSGAPGPDGLPASSPGADGLPGGPGQSGAQGTPGLNTENIDITADVFTGVLLINNSGGRGQDGAAGGVGGRGGAGAPGEPARSSLIGCSAGPGRGGNGGAGGRGGGGGAAGAGGTAGQVSLKFDVISVGSQIHVDALGGAPGSSGTGGLGGAGGAGGPEGETNTFCTSAGRRGSPGPAGPQGPPGATTSPGRAANVTLTLHEKVQTATGSAQFEDTQ